MSKERQNTELSTDSANQNWRKCGKCGKFISHEEMGKDAVCNFTPDTHFTLEKVEWIHNHCA